MREAKESVFFVGPEQHEDFWRLAGCIERSDIVRTISTPRTFINDLLAASRREPSVLVMSTDLLIEDTAKTILAAKGWTDASIIVAGRLEDPSLELEIRKAGILCFLVLPLEQELGNEAIHSAILAFKKNRQKGTFRPHDSAGSDSESSELYT